MYVCILQAQIAEKIRMSNVEANMETAIEQNPESFGRVVMLYVPMIVNNIKVTAFVDSKLSLSLSPLSLSLSLI